MHERKTLVGWWFLTRNENGFAEFQCRITSEIGPGYFIVQFFRWSDGRPTFSRIMTIEQLQECAYFTDEDQETHINFADLYQEGRAKIPLIDFKKSTD